MKTILDKRINIRLLILLSLLIIVGGQAHAESQFDIGMNVPYYAGLRTTDFGTVGQFNKYLFVIPDVKWHWYFGTESVRLGPGLRMWTLILQSTIYPQISFEAVLGDFVINAGIGGGPSFSSECSTPFKPLPSSYPSSPSPIAWARRKDSASVPPRSSSSLPPMRLLLIISSM